MRLLDEERDVFLTGMKHVSLLSISPDIGVPASIGCHGRRRRQSGPSGGFAYFVNAGDYVISHDIKSGTEQSDANELLKA
jgi:hypothetical protein